MSSTRLDRVVADLGLDRIWGFRAGLGRPLDPIDSVQALRNAVSLRQIRLTRLLDVQVSDPDPALAAKIANHLVELYREERVRRALPSSTAPFIIDPAEPGLRPVQPNVPLLWSAGAVTSLFVGGGTSLLVGFAGRRKRGAQPA